jgi:hypothetical protein
MGIVLAVAAEFDWWGIVGKQSYAPAFIAVMAAWLATWLLSRLIYLSMRSHGHLAQGADLAILGIERAKAVRGTQEMSGATMCDVNRESAMLVSSLGR